MTVDVVVIGAGGFGRETLDVIEASNAAGVADPVRVLGVVDDDPSPVNAERVRARGYALLGGIDEVMRTTTPGHYILGVGSPRAKAAIARRLDDAGWRAVTVIHPDAVIGSMASLGAGSVVCAGVQVSTNVVLGASVHLNPNATVGHDARLGDHTSVNPAAVISGEVDVGARVLVGAGAVVLQGLTVGDDAVVGASACVTRSVAARATVAGIPAREMSNRDASA